MNNYTTPKVKTGKKKMTVTAKTKVSATGGKKYYGAWSKIKTTVKVR